MNPKLFRPNIKNINKLMYTLFKYFYTIGQVQKIEIFFFFFLKSALSDQQLTNDDWALISESFKTTLQ